MATTKEQVSHILDPSAASHIPLFLPHIGLTNNNNNNNVEDANNNNNNNNSRPFQSTNDIDRVMDYPNMPDPPAPCLVMHCEAPGSGIDNNTEEEVYDGGLSFPKRMAKLSGGYIFLSKPKDNNKAAENLPSGAGEKIVCIPLKRCSVNFPPGGRRVFREHAHTGARKGYEMGIQIKFNGEDMTCYIVLDSLGQRETWAGAIRIRCDVGNKLTILRPGGIAGSRLISAADDAYDVQQPATSAAAAGGMMQGGVGGVNNTMRRGNMGKSQRNWGLPGNYKGAQKGPVSSGNADLDAAIEQFGVHGFKEDKWVHEFLRKHSVGQLPGECEQLEKWMDVIKNGLRGAVLEQYEYFVEASREMSTMGREVAWIRQLVERQQETLMSMRNIDFGAGFDEVDDGAVEDEYGYDMENDVLLDGMGNDLYDDAASSDSSSSDEDSNLPNARTPMRQNLRMKRLSRKKGGNNAPLAPVDESDTPPTTTSESSHVEIAPWISDVTEEVTAFIKESRYSDATDLILKARTEIADLLAKNDTTPPIVTTSASLSSTRNTGSTAPMSNTTTSNSPTKKLHKKQQALLQRINVQLDALMEKMSKRLAENLRRKNEALKASAKRERADPLSTLAPLVSPVCLNDDAIALHLLVKLGKYQEAATAYAARRSLLLSEW